MDRVLIIAEAGVNHDGCRDRVLALVDAAAECGADAVKFQHFSPARLVRGDAGLARYQADNLGRQQTQREMLGRLTLDCEILTQAAERAHGHRLMFLCTPFDPICAKDVEPLVPAWKVSSTDLNNWAFLDDLCATGKPLILSSGMATLPEVIAAVQHVTPLAKGNEVFAPVNLLHCVSAYPAPIDEVNVRAIPMLSERLGIPVGYSDHTCGVGASIAAVALGAQIIEKHLTIDNNLHGPDHAASLDVASFSNMVSAIRDASAALGEAVKSPQPSEIEHRLSVRRSLHTVRNLPQGHRLSAEDLIALRPADGIPPDRMNAICGRVLVRAIEAEMPLMPADIGDEC